MDRLFEANAVLSVFSKNYMELKKGLPVRPSEMGVLNIIVQTSGPHTPVMLAQLLRVSKPMITAHLTSLEDKGYITKTPSPEDKRAYYILPTQKAVTLVGNAKVDTDRQLESMKNAMGQAEFERFISLVKCANSVLEANRGEKK